MESAERKTKVQNYHHLRNYSMEQLSDTQMSNMGERPVTKVGMEKIERRHIKIINRIWTRAIGQENFKGVLSNIYIRYWLR